MDPEQLPPNFTRKLADFTPRYAPGAWEAFEQHRRANEERRRRLGWVYRLAALLALLLLGGLGYFWRLRTVSPSGPELAGQQAARMGAPADLGRAEGAARGRGLPPPADRTGERLAGARSGAVRPASPVLRSSSPAATRPFRSAPAGRGRSGPFTAGKTRRVRLAADRPLSSPRLPADDNGREDPVYGPSRAAGRSERALSRLALHAIRPLRVRLGTPVIPATVATERVPATGRPAGGRLWLGAGLLSQANYAQAGPSTPTPGGLVSAELALGHRLSVASGLGIAPQFVTVEGEAAAQPVANGLPQLTQASYRWLGLDVPLTVRYRLLPQKKRPVFASVGVSSVLALRQHYEQEYRTDRLITMEVVQLNGEIREVVRQETEYGRVQGRTEQPARFQPARFLTASLGFERPLSARQLLIVEPYFKYPVGDVSAEQLRYSTVGLQLRWSYRFRRRSE